MNEGAMISLPEGAKLERFRPIAYFDKHMDCIRVLTHDRSVTEHRIGGFLTVYECNHPSRFDPKYVGFTIKGVKCLFHDLGLPLDGVYKLAEIIDHIVRHRPGSAMSETLSLIYDGYQTAGDLEVDFKSAA